MSSTSRIRDVCGTVIFDYFLLGLQCPSWPVSSTTTQEKARLLRHFWQSIRRPSRSAVSSLHRSVTLMYIRSPADGVSVPEIAISAILQTRPSPALPGQGSLHPAARDRSYPALPARYVLPPGSATDGPVARAKYTGTNHCHQPAKASWAFPGGLPGGHPATRSRLRGVGLWPGPLLNPKLASLPAAQSQR